MLNFNRNKIFTDPMDYFGRERIKHFIEETRGFCDVSEIGKSILSRPIEAFSVGDGKRVVTVFAAHHAQESITSNIAYLLIDLLLGSKNEKLINTIDCKLLLSKYRFMIVPCVNPDGVELSFHGADDSLLKERQMRMSGGDFIGWQANARGVDLNHNYDFGFEEYKLLEADLEIIPGKTLYSGEYPESEPEARCVANLVRVISPMAVVSLHSQGEEIYAYPDTKKVRSSARRLSALTGYSLEQPTGTAAYGGLCNYTSSLGIPSFTYEVGRGKNPIPSADAFRIFERVAESLVLLPTLL